MRSILSMLALLSFISISPAQSPVEVRVRTEDSWFQNNAEWVTWTFADLYDEHEHIIPPSQEYYYHWEYRVSPSGTWQTSASGYGQWAPQFDGHYGEVHYTRVRVTIGQMVLESSGDDIISKGGVPRDVYCFGKREDGSAIDGTPVRLQNWTGTTWELHTRPSTDEQEPSYFYLTDESNELLRIVPNYEATLGEKFRHWIPDATNVVNYNTLFISNQSNEMRPQYWTNGNDAIVRNSLADTPEIDIDSVEFKDPWLPDLDTGVRGLRNQGMQAPFKKVATPFNPNSNETGPGSAYKGVFFDQVVELGTYYSVRAPLSKEVNGITWLFQNWQTSGGVSLQQVGSNPTGYDQKAVIFTGADAVVTARYKAHLGSSLASATSTNGQRKYAADIVPGSVRQAIGYASAAQIWVSDNIGQGSGFETDELVSSGAGSFSLPSLFVANGGDPPIGGDELEESSTLPQIAVVYQKDGSTREVWFRDKRPYAWNPPQYLGGESIDTYPVIGRTGNETNPKLLAVWQGSNGLRFRTGTFNSTGNTWTWTTVQTITGTQSGDQNPSVTCGFNSTPPEPPFYLTYDDELDISLQKFTSSWLATPLTVPSSVAPVSYASQVAADTRSTPADLVHIVWEAREEEDPNTPRVMYQGYLGGEKWTTASQFISEGSGFFRPSITYLDNGTLVMAWDDGSSLYQARLEAADETWAVSTDGEERIHAQLPQPGPNSTLASARILATATSGPPYALQLTDEITGAFNRTAGIARVESGREINVSQRPQAKSDPAPFFSLRIQSIALRLADGTMQPLELTQVNSREPGLNEQNAWAYLSTKQRNLTASAESLIVEASAVAKAPGSILGNGEEAIRVSFDLVDANNDRVIRRIGSERVVRENGVLTFSIRERITDLAGRSIYIRPRLKGLAQGRERMVYSLVHLHRVFHDSSASRPVEKPVVQHNAVQQIPPDYAIHPSYPNPFNPTTQIRFELPLPANVSLVVYDMLGREVARLVNGTREAGYHSATWDASSVASGVYFARFAATDAGGNIKLHNVTKLLLTK